MMDRTTDEEQNLSADFFCKKLSGKRSRATEELLCGSRPSSPRGWAGAPTLVAGRQGARSPHTPAWDWPVPQSFSSDTSGQPLPPYSRPLLPALGKKRGQRGAGTKDPAAHSDQGRGATPTPGPRHCCSLAPAPRLHAPGPGRALGGESRRH